ncbi:Imm26 family immunity protein [Endozoicomonadaceae bacterium StTr2]
MARRKKWEPGNVVEIELDDGSFSYGVVVEEPLVAFISNTFAQRPEISPKLFSDLAFQLWIMSSAIGKNGWPVIGDVQLDELLIPEARFYRYDILSKKFYHYVDCVNDIPSTRKRCAGWECAAVWERSHVKDRLQAYKAGLECQWEASLRAESRV